jgi:hypothetical protein
MACAECRGPLPAQPCAWRGQLFCSTRCTHDAGDRNACRAGCGCTAYARKRRQLRKHREQMRVMEDIIAEAGLSHELEERMIEETGNTGFWLGEDSEMDEGSNKEDPERPLREELRDRQQMIQAVRGALECQAMRRDLERARGCSWRTSAEHRGRATGTAQPVAVKMFRIAPANRSTLPPAQNVANRASQMSLTRSEISSAKRPHLPLAPRFPRPRPCASWSASSRGSRSRRPRTPTMRSRIWRGSLRHSV